MLIDTHAHLNDPRLLPEAGNIVQTMDNDGLSAIVNVGYDRESSETAVKLALDYAPLYAVVGIHPHDSKTATKADYDYFSSVAKNDKVVAIGEIGLDYYYDLSPRETQIAVLKQQIELADFLKLPLVFHVRDAYGDMLKVLNDMKRYFTHGAVLHCYSGSAEMVKEFNRFDFYYSFGGAITFKNAKKEDVVAAVGKDRILIETDCPYMTPVPFRGQTNYPKYVTLVRDKLAELLPDLDISAITRQNAKDFFQKIK